MHLPRVCDRPSLGFRINGFQHVRTLGLSIDIQVGLAYVARSWRRVELIAPLNLDVNMNAYSMVSKAVGKEEQGEALGALNGLKALTEGVGPLIFGVLMHTSEDSIMPVSSHALLYIRTSACGSPFDDYVLQIPGCPLFAGICVCSLGVCTFVCIAFRRGASNRKDSCHRTARRRRYSYDSRT